MLFILAAVFGVLGVGLLLIDAHRSRTSAPTPGDEVAEPEVSAAFEPADFESADVEPGDDQPGDDQPETEVIAEVAAEEPEEFVDSYENYFEGDDLTPPREHEQPAEQHKPVPVRANFPALPGASRRERKAWAAHHGFGYTKADEFLTEEWSRGAAAHGAPAKDVVSGMAGGHEMHLVDLGGVPVMAMRKPVATDIVVDIRRGDEEGSGDLIYVSSTSGWQVWASDQGCAERMMDVRMQKALEEMPEDVTAVWIESDWVLAQMEKSALHETWDAMIAPLALVAEASRVLPPEAGATTPVDFSEADPSRPMPEAPRLEEEPDEDVAPVILMIERREEPIELPTRGERLSKGVVEPRSLGDDDVDAIADGAKKEPSTHGGTRVLREQQESSIFGDAERDEDSAR